MLISRLKIALTHLLPQHSFARSAGVLFSGTAASQAIAVLALPLLTRMYNPTDFGVLAIYVALVSIIAAVACLRLEIAIPLPEKDEDAIHLLVLALLSASTFGLLVLLLVIVVPAQIIKLTGLPTLEPYLLLLPLGIWATASYTAMQYWATRNHQFVAIARTRLAQAASGTGMQLLGGMAGIGSVGLLLGQIIKSSAGIGSLIRLTWTHDKHVLKTINRDDLIRLFRTYDRFPKYSTLESFSNMAGIQIPILLIAAFVGGKESGFLMLAIQVMSVPAGLLASASRRFIWLTHPSICGAAICLSLLRAVWQVWPKWGCCH